MRIRTAFILGGAALSAVTVIPFASALAASAACSGASLTELRMTECLSPATRGIRPASPAASQPGASQPGGGQQGGALSPAAQAQPGLDLEITFSFGSAELTGDAKGVLQKLAHVLSVGDLASRSIKLVGHTDAAGSDEMNKTLSMMRAQAVSAYLAEQGVAGRRLIASGVGSSVSKNPQNPLAAENRRVEIVPAG